LKGWILVEPAGVKTDRSLETRVSPAVDYASSLPAKGKLAAKKSEEPDRPDSSLS
jgi:hypothetical protein